MLEYQQVNTAEIGYDFLRAFSHDFSSKTNGIVY